VSAVYDPVATKELAENLLDQWHQYHKLNPANQHFPEPVELTIMKDDMVHFADHLRKQLRWGNDVDVAKATHNFEMRFNIFRDRITIDVLKNGLK
jgi:hypothetical protein